MKPQPGAASHAVPRPPSAGGFEGRGNVNSSVRTGPANNSGMNSRTEVQRPMMSPSANSRPESRSAAPQMSSRGESVPRPPAGGMSRSIEQPSSSGRGNSDGSVPAPHGQVSGGGRSGG